MIIIYSVDLNDLNVHVKLRVMMWLSVAVIKIIS